jgi:hypothetical protein
VAAQDEAQRVISSRSTLAGHSSNTQVAAGFGF